MPWLVPPGNGSAHVAGVGAGRAVGENLHGAVPDPAVALSGPDPGTDGGLQIVLGQQFVDAQGQCALVAEGPCRPCQGVSTVDVVDAGQAQGQQVLLGLPQLLREISRDPRSGEFPDRVNGALPQDPGGLAVLVADDFPARGIRRRPGDAQ